MAVTRPLDKVGWGDASFYIEKGLMIGRRGPSVSSLATVNVYKHLKMFI